MSIVCDRENFIPVRRQELIDVLSADRDVPRAEQERFRSLCQLLCAIYHHEYNQRLERLKNAYAPFDPDADTRSLCRLSEDEKLQRLNTLFSELAAVLEEADYKHLSRDEIEPAINASSAWGLRMDVDFRVFERLAMFARGITHQKRSLRRIRKALRSEELDVPIYQRLVMVMKLRQHNRLGKHVDSESVYLQLFKNIPRLDINMLLPGARVRMTRFDRSRIFLTLIIGLALTAWQIAFDVVGAVARQIAALLVFRPAAVIWAAATGTLGYCFKSWWDYYQTRQRYNLYLAQILYYQNLDTNIGVVYRLLDEAEEQDCREAILAYYCLWRKAGNGWTCEQLTQHVENDLQHRANLQIAFEHHGCLRKLERLGVIEKHGDRYSARIPLDSLEALEKTWQRYLRQMAPETAPVDADDALAPARST